MIKGAIIIAAVTLVLAGLAALIVFLACQSLYSLSKC